MIIFDVFRISTRSFKNNSLRTFLTILGISVGIGTIFFLVTLGYGFQKLIIEKIATEGALLTLDVAEKSQAVLLNDSGLEQVKGIPEVKNVYPVVTQQAKIENEGFLSDVKLNMVDSDYLKLDNISLKSGKYFGDDERNVILSAAVLELLGIDKNDALDKKVNVIVQKENDSESENFLQIEYNIIGVIDDSAQATAYIPLANVKDDAGITTYSKLKIKANSETDISAARDKIIELGYFVSSVSELVEQAKQVFNVARIILVLFGIVSLVVSAIGMFNTMTIALLERTQEIGTMRAIGASKFDIWKMFLMESIIIGFLGGTFGLIIGYSFGRILNFSVNMLAKSFGGLEVELFYIPIWFVVFIIIFSSIVGLITGFYPARRAARLNALQALRYK